MTKAQALKLARAEWGKGAVLYSRPNAGTAETRASALAELREHTAAKPKERGEAYNAWYERRNTLMARVHSYRCQVARTRESPIGPITGILGSGDTWEDACKAAGLL